ncbi:hypothetical protein BJP34_27795 [Moorena producens PAL-8-15-08-1]|uniref:Uncharacterized protein n=1 Tax=Moorena producens PAL-8-15-08-1 TaxID=1458985 RepID=A0A1D8TYK7_9CYAN|nr:hypothetical protein BJP34_27795 [Moorena producens PAL-8-15-08-1]
MLLGTKLSVFREQGAGSRQQEPTPKPLIRVGFLQRPQVLGLGCGVWGVGYKKAMQQGNRGFPP